MSIIGGHYVLNDIRGNIFWECYNVSDQGSNHGGFTFEVFFHIRLVVNLMYGISIFSAVYTFPEHFFVPIHL